MTRLKTTNKPFPLGHLCLYAKGWYKSSGNLFEDLMKVLELDGYTPFHKSDVLSIVLHRYNETMDVDLVDFLNDVQESTCHRVGYCPEEGKFDLQEAYMMKVLSDIRFLEFRQWEYVIPNYTKGLEKPNDITTQKILSIFNRNEKYRKFVNLQMEYRDSKVYWGSNNTSTGVWVEKEKSRLFFQI